MKALCFSNIFEEIQERNIEDMEMRGIKSFGQSLRSKTGGWSYSGDVSANMCLLLGKTHISDLLIGAGPHKVATISNNLADKLEALIFTIRPENIFEMETMNKLFSGSDCPYIVFINKSPLNLTSLKVKMVESDYPYTYIEQSFDFQKGEIQNKTRNVSITFAQKNNNKFTIPEIFGFWNFITNELYTNITDENLLNQLKDEVRMHPLYSVHFELSHKKQLPDVLMGIEQEWLFLKDREVVPAHAVYLNWIDNHFHINPNNKQNLLVNGRGMMNEVFTHTTMGTDSRRILGESRSDPFRVKIKDAQFNQVQVLNMYGMLRTHYQKISDMGYEMQIGGGKDGESISSHFTFSGFSPSENLIRLWNKFVVELLQKMEGGLRPKRINPADRFEKGDNNRAQNHYGVINYDNPFSDDNVRIKTESDDGFRGFEFRTAPACFLNKTFTVNIIQTLLYFLQKDEFDFETKNAHTVSNWAKSFDDFIPAWEFYYMTKSLSLLASPLDYNLPSRMGNIFDKMNFVVSGDKMFAEEINWMKLKQRLMDYVHYPVYVKFHCNLKNRILGIPPQYRKDAAILFQVFNIKDVIIQQNVPHYATELFVIEGNNFTNNALYSLLKIICLINHCN